MRESSKSAIRPLRRSRKREREGRRRATFPTVFFPSSFKEEVEREGGGAVDMCDFFLSTSFMSFRTARWRPQVLPRLKQPRPHHRNPSLSLHLPWCSRPAARQLTLRRWGQEQRRRPRSRWKTSRFSAVAGPVSMTHEKFVHSAGAHCPPVRPSAGSSRASKDMFFRLCSYIQNLSLFHTTHSFLVLQLRYSDRRFVRPQRSQCHRARPRRAPRRGHQQDATEPWFVFLLLSLSTCYLLLLLALVRMPLGRGVP